MTQKKSLKILLHGEAWWAAITGQGKLNYNEDGYEHQITLVMDKDSDDAKKLVKAVDEIVKEHLPKVKEPRLPYRDWQTKEDDEDIVDDTKISISAKQNAYAVSKETGQQIKDKPRKLIIRDSSGNEVDLGDKKLGNRSQVAVSINLVPYDNKNGGGISAYLGQVMIINPNWYDDNPFKDVNNEGGWTAEDEMKEGEDASINMDD